jgi:hypothetical protein
MLLWCRMPLGMGLVRKIAKRAGAIVSPLAEHFGPLARFKETATNGSDRQTRVASLVSHLIDANVSRVLIVGASASESVADAMVEALQSADYPIEVARHTDEARADYAGFDCIIVCETVSFEGYSLVSDILSHPDWELVGSGGDVEGESVVFRRVDEYRSRGGWEILDVLSRDLRGQQRLRID